jgi:actin related protein 2/3 complex subunit 2
MTERGGENKILLSALTNRLSDGRREPCELKVADFNDVCYKLMVPPEAPNMITLNVALRDWKNLKENGAQAALDENFPGCETSPESGFDVAIVVNADELPKGPWGTTGEACARQLADIKTLLVGAPIMASFKNFVDGGAAKTPVLAVNQHKPTLDGGGDFYVCQKADRVTVLFAVDFADETDKAICRVFMQEFVEAQRQVNNAPPSSYARGAEPPMELAGMKGVDACPNIAGFLSFTLFKNHIETRAKQLNVVNLMVGFTTYLQYHIKCTKTYMHMRMRAKVSGLLQVLNRSIQTSSEEKEKKTFGGKTFTRK